MLMAAKTLKEDLFNNNLLLKHFSLFN